MAIRYSSVSSIDSHMTGSDLRLSMLNDYPDEVTENDYPTPEHAATTSGYRLCEPSEHPSEPLPDTRLTNSSHGSSQTLSDAPSRPQSLECPKREKSKIRQPQSSPASVGKRFLRLGWRLEITLLILSVTSLVSAIILLSTKDGIPLKNWAFYFSLNTIISVLGAISRASLASAVGSCIAQEKWNWFQRGMAPLYIFDRIDNASRGPLGSIKLLCWLKCCHWVSLGALVMLVLLGYEPFIQAILVQAGRDDQTGGDLGATIGSSFKLDVGSMGVISESQGGEYWNATATDPPTFCQLYYYFGTWFSETDLGMSSAVYTGFSNQSTTPMPKFSCRSGNCTWDPFASLALCASCRDITKHLEKSTFPAYYLRDGGNNHEWWKGYQTSFSLPNINLTNWLPGADFEVQAVGRDLGNASHINTTWIPGSLDLTMAAIGSVDGRSTFSFVNSTTLVYAFTIINAEEANTNTSTPFNESRPTATECGLEFCTNIYKSEVRNGELFETVLGSVIQRDRESLFPVYLAQDEVCALSWLERQGNGLYVNTTGLNVEVNPLKLSISEKAAKDFGITNAPHANFSISQATLVSSIRWLDENLGVPLYGSTRLDSQITPRFSNGQSPIYKSFLNASDLQNVFDRVAYSMTVWMRNLDYEHSTVVGTSSSWILHIRIRWAFLVLPVITTFAGCVFCLVVILETRRLELEPWRDSCLATMVYGIHDDLRVKIRAADLGPDDGLKTAALGTRVALTRSGGDGDCNVIMLREEEPNVRTIS